jgi:hypothetical protein
VRLLCDPEEGVMVVPVSEEQKAAAAQKGEGKALQFMMSFNMQDWEAMKLLVLADGCIMPHRGHAAGGVHSRADGQSEQQQAKRARRA